jgi:hypothetical protein
MHRAMVQLMLKIDIVCVNKAIITAVARTAVSGAGAAGAAVGRESNPGYC